MWTVTFRWRPNYRAVLGILVSAAAVMGACEQDEPDPVSLDISKLACPPNQIRTTTGECVCAAGYYFNSSFTECVAGGSGPSGDGGCAPSCGGKECGDDGCGGSCGSCGGGESCTGGQCKSGCTPSCGGKECGDDGCGGSCGSCGDAYCSGGQCISDCAPSCGGKECGDDGCGGVCGSCSVGTVCNTSGQCECAVQCTGKDCGQDGCGGVCGICEVGTGCSEGGRCEPWVVSDGMVEVPAGAFWMGCENCSSGDASPYHEVTLDAFQIGQTEVTVSEYLACVQSAMCEAPSGLKSNVGCNWGVSGMEEHPVSCVDWKQAAGYCAWRGARLCTEAEWEKAARGTDGRIYPWGDTDPSCTYAVFNPGGDEEGCGTGWTWPVGLKPAGACPYGALDMAGNLFEWVADWYDSTYYGGSPTSNPKGAGYGVERVTRGSGYQYVGETLRAYRRYPNSPGGHYYVGFRCCRSVEP